MNIRVGEGWDTHALVAGRPLMLGGVQIPFEKGLLGHSDADVLLHAITDALLGAAGLGDIGQHFPDTDATYKGANSVVLLKKAYDHVKQLGWQLGNVDCTIVAQAPKLSPHRSDIRSSIAKALGVTESQVNVSVRMPEKKGVVGEGLSIEARAMVMVLKP